MFCRFLLFFFLLVGFVVNVRGVVVVIRHDAMSWVVEGRGGAIHTLINGLDAVAWWWVLACGGGGAWGVGPWGRGRAAVGEPSAAMVQGTKAGRWWTEGRRGNSAIFMFIMSVGVTDR